MSTRLLTSTEISFTVDHFTLSNQEARSMDESLHNLVQTFIEHLDASGYVVDSYESSSSVETLSDQSSSGYTSMAQLVAQTSAQPTQSGYTRFSPVASQNNPPTPGYVRLVR